MKKLTNVGRLSALLSVALIAGATSMPSSAADSPEKSPEIRTVAILVFNGMDIQDFAGPADVFFYAQTPEGRASFKQFAVAKTMDPIISQGFVKIVPNYTFADCPKADILVIPGGGVNGVMPSLSPTRPRAIAARRRTRGS